MLDNPDVEAGQTIDTASHARDYVLLLLIDLLALIAQVNERVAVIIPIGKQVSPNWVGSVLFSGNS